MPVKLRPLLLILPLLLPACAPSEADRKSLQNGFAQYSARDFDASEAAASAYITKNPTAPNLDEAYYLRGLSRLSRENKPAATEDLLAAIAKSKRNDLKAKASRALGDIAFDAPHWEQAMDYYQKAVAFAPDEKPETLAVYRIGACLQSLGQWEKAIPYFRRVIVQNSDPLLTQRALSRINLHAFALQFGAFQDAPNAAALIRQLKTAGITATATTELREAHLTYLIRSGTFPTWEQATTARSLLLPKFPTLTIVP